MVDKILKQEQGLTFDVFKDKEPTQQDEEQNEEGDAEKKPKEEEEKLPQYIFVKEVVREPRMHYY